MEIQVLFAAHLILLTVIAKKLRTPRTNLPPGPPKLPIIGNLHQFGAGPPGPLLQEMSHRYGCDLMHLRLGQVDHIVVSSQEAAREILQTHDTNFASRPKLITTDIIFYGRLDVAFSPYGNYWRQVRKILNNGILSAGRVKACAPLREEESFNLVEHILSNSEHTSATGGEAVVVNVTKNIREFVVTAFTKTAVGSKSKNAEKLFSVGRSALPFMHGLNLADLFPSLSLVDALTGQSLLLKKIHEEVDAILDEIIEEHVATRGRRESRDLVDVLLAIQEEGGLEFPLATNNVKAVILDMFLGGIATTSAAAVNAMTELMLHPAVMKKLQSEVRGALRGKERIEDSDLEELQYMNMVVKETLRMRPPGQILLPRSCSTSCRVMGYDVPEGTRVLVNVWALGRDPEYWEDAESFKPERFEGSRVDFRGGNFEYLPFGAGRRMCPGISFGLAHAKLVLAQLLYHFDWSLVDGMTARDLDTAASKRLDYCLLAWPHTAPQNAK